MNFTVHTRAAARFPSCQCDSARHELDHCDGANTDETVLQGDVAAAKMTGDLLSKEMGQVYQVRGIAQQHRARMVEAEQNLPVAQNAYTTSKVRMQQKLERVQALTTRVAQQEACSSNSKQPGTTVRRRSGAVWATGTARTGDVQCSTRAQQRAE